MSRAPAFTLIELLVVVAIIIVLISMLVPAIERAMQEATVAVCASRLDGQVTVYTLYASENRAKLYPSGKRNGDDYEHAPWVSKEFVAIFESYSGRNNQQRWTDGTKTTGIVPLMLIDPTFGDFGYRYETYGYVIGYQYLGGHPYLSNANRGQQDFGYFESPIGIANAGTKEIATCWISWAVGGWTFSAHKSRGAPLGSDSPNGGGYHYGGVGAGQDPLQAKTCVGGHVAMVDGSVAWKDIEDTKMYINGASAGGGDPTWRARW